MTITEGDHSESNILACYTFSALFFPSVAVNLAAELCLIS